MTDVSESYLESLRESATANAQALTDEQHAHNVTKQKLAQQTEHTDAGNARLAIEQRQHGITEQQRDVLQQQCEDMQEELDVERKVSKGALKRYGYDETRIAKQERDACNIRIAQVDEACKAAEEKVVEQRKEIEALKRGEDMRRCSYADECHVTPCEHRTPHPHTGGCTVHCRHGAKCVPVNTCKECSTLKKQIAALTINADRCAICESTQLEEITNRDAVILEYERRAEDREEIIKALAEEVKAVRESMDRRKEVSKQRVRIIQSIEFTAPPTNTINDRIAKDMLPVDGKFKRMFSGKRHEMPTAEEREKRDRRMCKYWGGCLFRKASSKTCNTGGGEYCGMWRKAEAETAGACNRG